jgi:hypothetical protein
VIEIPFDFSLRSYQRNFFASLDAGFRRAVLVWHRRSGKDKALLNAAIRACLGPKRITAMIFYPTLKQVRLALWHGLDRDGKPYIWRHIPPDLISRTNESEMSITLVNGSILHLLGADNVNRLVGVNPSFIVFNEFSLEDPKLAELYRPIAAENNATMIYAGTPRGMDHLQKIFQYAQSDPERWYSSLLTIDDTRRDADGEDGGPVIDQEAVDQDRAEGADEDLLRQEYMCSFNGVTVGSFYGKQVQTMREELG